MKPRPSLLHALHRASQVAEALFAKALDGSDVTARQAAVLAAIVERQACSQADIVNATGIDRSTTADIVRRLLSAGLVTRKRDREDARAYVVKLTASGETMLRRANIATERAEAVLDARLSSAQRKALDEALERLIAIEESSG